MFWRNKNSFFAISVFVGTTVGAGIFGLPYVISKSGIIPGLFYFLILGGAMFLMSLFLGEIVLRTKEKHRLPGFAKKYLGKNGEIIVTIAKVIGLTGALLAYIILGGSFLEILFSPLISVSSFYFSLFFWAALVYFIFRGIKLIAPIEILTNSIFFIIIFIVFCFALPKIDFQNFIPFTNFSDIFLPYGVILFSLMGLSAVPEIIEILKTTEEKKNFKKVISLSFFVIIFLYALFILAVIGVTGGRVTSDALEGLVPFLGPNIIFLVILAAIITLADSFFVIALNLRNVLIYDFKTPKRIAASFTCGIPLFLFLIGFQSFIGTIGFIGTLIGVLEGIAIILIFKKTKKLGDREPEYSLKVPSVLLYGLMAIFILGAISQIYYFIK